MTFFRSILAFAIVLAAMTVPLQAVTTGLTGEGDPHTNLQPSLAINYFVDAGGVFESLGRVRMTAVNFVPGPFLAADGQLLSIAANTALFAKIGTTYGGDGITTFALPDLRGRTPVHPDGSSIFLGTVIGSEQVFLTEDQIPSHNHTLPPSPDMTGNTGGGQAHPNRQPQLGLNYMIATAGIFPSDQGVISQEPLLGEVGLFATSNAPQGWELADGHLLSINQNQALFALLGTTYGGDGITTFALPDLRGRTAIHAGDGPGLTPQILGQTGGLGEIILSEAQMPSHDHTLLPSADLTGNTGGSQPHSNMAPTTALNYIIATAGLFPSQNGGGATDEQFIGEIRLIASNFAPGGWEFLDGQLLSIAQNIALFSLLGTTYGGDGQTTFALPDLRGRLPIHFGQGPGLSDYFIGQQFGVESVVVTLDQLPRHLHELADVPIVPEPTVLALGLVSLTSLALRRRRASA
ncbi:MAG: tail fiber protein [Phycisphaeraceae bacterium]